MPIQTSTDTTVPPNTTIVVGEGDDAREISGATFNACGEDGWICQRVYEWTENEFLSDTSQVVVGTLLPILVILVAGWIANRLIARTITTMVGRLTSDVHARAEAARSAVDTAEQPELKARALRELEAQKAAEIRGAKRAETLGTVLRSIVTITIGTIVVVMIIAEFGVSLGPLIAGAGIAGAALGFGAQSLVKDFLTGMFMLAEDQYGVGDVVDLGEAVGTVEEVQLRITKVRALDGTLWFVPNGEITRVANMTKLWARVVLDVEVAYDTDLDHASDVIVYTAHELWRTDPRIHDEPELWGVETFGASSIGIRLAMNVDAGQQWSVARELRRRLKAALDAEGIEIPFPQRTVWMRTEAEGAVPVEDEPAPVPASDRSAEREAPEGDVPGEGS